MSKENMLSGSLIQYPIQSEHSIICSVCRNLTVSREEGACSESETLPGGTLKQRVFQQLQWGRGFGPTWKIKNSVEIHLESQSPISQNGRLEECQTEGSRSHN